ncbi:MAG: DNA-binding protein [Pirellulales bacterium]|nr:DNA-binding protein [Pirellulales bacterium]
MARKTNQTPSFLDPNRLYTLRGFQQASGISSTRMREARLQGIRLPAINVGRRKFVRGLDAIAYVERLATL